MCQKACISALQGHLESHVAEIKKVELCSFSSAQPDQALCAHSGNRAQEAEQHAGSRTERSAQSRGADGRVQEVPDSARVMLAVQEYFRQCNVVLTMPEVCGTSLLQRCEVHPVFTGMPHFWTLLRHPNGLQHRMRSMTRSGRRALCDILHAVLGYQGCEFVNSVYCST